MFFIKKTKILPLNNSILIQRVKETDNEPIIKHVVGALKPTTKHFKQLVIAVSPDVTCVKVGDVVETRSVWVRDGHKEVFVRRYPLYTQLFDDKLNYYFDVIPDRDLRVLSEGKQGVTWDYEKPKSKIKLI